MPAFKLSYTNARGRAEPCRILFHLAGQEFEDHRISHAGWFLHNRYDHELYPIGQVPVLYFDNILIPQGKAIARYLAHRFGYMGDNALERAQIDAVVDAVFDIECQLLPSNELVYADMRVPQTTYFVLDVNKRPQAEKRFQEETSVPLFTYLNDTVKNNGGKYFVGKKYTLADINVFTWLDQLTNSRYAVTGTMDRYPALKSFFTQFWNDPSLKGYLETRPATNT